jgi:hypothetical protein
MYEEKLLPARADPLRHIDVRFEPRDPVFDVDEPVFGRHEPRRRRPARRRSRSADPFLDEVVIE